MKFSRKEITVEKTFRSDRVNQPLLRAEGIITTEGHTKILVQCDLDKLIARR